MHLDPRLVKLGLRIAVIVAVALAVWAFMGVYSSGPSFSSYVSPAHAFLRAALARDAAALARQGADPAVVQWAVRAAQADTASWQTIERGLYLGSGYHRGDTTVVWYYALAHGPCVSWRLTMTFLGRGKAARIPKATVFCIAPTPPSGAGLPKAGGPA